MLQKQQRTVAVIGGFMVASMLLITCYQHRSKKSLQTLEEFATTLKTKHELQMVVVGTGDSIYLSTEPHSLKELMMLTKQNWNLPAWKGIVVITRVPQNDPLFESNLEEWDKAAFVIDDFLVWGDPDLIATLKKEWAAKFYNSRHNEEVL